MRLFIVDVLLVITFGAAVVVVLFGAVACLQFLWSCETLGLRVTLVGYDGCRCADCARHYGLPPLGAGWSWLANASIAASAAVLATASHVCSRRIERGIVTPAPSRCTCGYDTRGLPGNVCPECGQVFNAPAST